MKDPILIRAAQSGDFDSILRMFDDNVNWLVQEGRSEQWGSDPWSADARKRQFVHDLVSACETHVAERHGEVIGAISFRADPIVYVPRVEEPELYVHLLIASPAERGSGIGSTLLQVVREQAQMRGINLIRVDCWAGGDRKLVRYYQGQGFVPVQEIEVRPGTSVQVFELRLPETQ